MANQIKQYFLAPSWDYLPGGAITLGNIITLPTRPVPALVAASTINPEGRISSTKSGVEWQKNKTSAHKFGIWTKFVEFLGINVGVDIASDSDDVFRFEKMYTEEFFPDEEYIQTALQKSPLATKILTKQKKPLFIIVGVKTVSGAVVKRAHSRQTTGSLDVAFDAALVGSPVPVSIGPSVTSSSGAKESVSFEGSDDFVFAIRVQKLRVKKQEVTQEDYTKGTAYNNEVGGKKKTELLEIGDLDSSDSPDGFLNRDVEDEDDPVQVFVPTAVSQKD